MKLSIITINYNNAEGLRKTLASVAAQTYADIKHIIAINLLLAVNDYSFFKFFNMILQKNASQKMYLCASYNIL